MPFQLKRSLVFCRQWLQNPIERAFLFWRKWLDFAPVFKDHVFYVLTTAKRKRWRTQYVWLLPDGVRFFLGPILTKLHVDGGVPLLHFLQDDQNGTLFNTNKFFMKVCFSYKYAFNY
jgi:hypothetical protein